MRDERIPGTALGDAQNKILMRERHGDMCSFYLHVFGNAGVAILVIETV